jgi:hypothetical protein
MVPLAWEPCCPAPQADLLPLGFNISIHATATAAMWLKKRDFTTAAISIHARVGMIWIASSSLRGAERRGNRNDEKRAQSALW